MAPVAVLLLMPLPPYWHGRWQAHFLDLGHVPLFFALTLALAWVWRGRLLGPVLIALAAAGLAEVIQPHFGRTGDVLDFVRGALGTLAAAAVLRAWRGPRTAGRLAAHGLAVLALLAWPLVDEVPWLLDAYRGARAFPTLADFDTSGELLRWECLQAELTREPDPERPGRWVGRLVMLPGEESYPGAYLEPVVRDWSGYRHVCCTFTVKGEPLRLVFSLRSSSREAGRSTHYQEEKVYPPGEHRACLDLDGAARKARPLPLDLTRVRNLHIFTYDPEQARVVRLHRVWLE
jgi:hypothetical protein